MGEERNASAEVSGVLQLQTGSHDIAQAGPEFTILLPLPPE